MFSPALNRSEGSHKNYPVLQPVLAKVLYRCQKNNNETIGKYFPYKNGYWKRTDSFASKLK